MKKPWQPLGISFRSPSRALAAGLTRQDHVYKTTTGVVDNIDHKLSRYLILDPRSTAIRSECNPIDSQYRPYSSVSVILLTVDIDCILP